MVNRASDDTGDVRARILAEARHLFAAAGFDATPVRQIAEQVGVTVPALYYHFGSKDGILRALVEQHLERKERLIAEAAGSSGDPATRLRRALSAYLEFLSDEESSSWIVVRDPRLLADTGLAELVRSSDGRAAEDLRGLVEAGMRSGAFRPADPLLTAHLLLAGARSSVLSRSVGGLGYTRQAVTDAALELLLGGLSSRDGTA